MDKQNDTKKQTFAWPISASATCIKSTLTTKKNKNMFYKTAANIKTTIHVIAAASN